MLLAICTAAAHTGTASAADLGGGTAADSPVSELQEIIVSARKRDESLANLPISISVFTAATIQEQNIQSFDDYATKVPNLSFTSVRARRGSPKRVPSPSAASRDKT